MRTATAETTNRYANPPDPYASLRASTSNETIARLRSMLAFRQAVYNNATASLAAASAPAASDYFKQPPPNGYQMALDRMKGAGR